MDFSALYSKITRFFSSILENGGLCIVLAIVFLLYAVTVMRERKSSAGMFFVIVIAVALFMIGMGNLTGLGFGMSF